MKDALSILELNSATLHSTATGLQLTRGAVVVKGDSFLSSDATIVEEAIRFGDGILAANDADLVIEPEAECTCLGYVRDKSVNA